MNNPLTLGKLWGLRRLASNTGHFSMLAIDQRPPIEQAIAVGRKINPSAVAFDDMVLVKRLLAEVLAPHASATLVDPNYAYPAAIDVLSANQGLILTLEDHRFEVTPAGRQSHSIKNWTVDKIRRIGGDAVKVLAWWRPDIGDEVRAHQARYVKEVGLACKAADIPFIFELLVYPFPSEAGHTTAYTDDPNKHPQWVIDSVREFSKPEYGVDLFKLESPVPAANLPSFDAPEALKIQKYFDEIGALCDAAHRPWVMLSAGAKADQFANVLRFAYTAGANGYLAGRAIWWESLKHFPDLQKAREQLEHEGVPYMRELVSLTAKHAKPWQPNYQLTARAEGEFAAGY